MRRLLKATRGSSRRASAHAEPRPACPSSPGEEQLALGAILARASLPGAPLLNRRGFDRERKYGPWLVPTFEDRVYNWVWGSGPAWDSTPEVLAGRRARVAACAAVVVDGHERLYFSLFGDFESYFYEVTVEKLRALCKIAEWGASEPSFPSDLANATTMLKAAANDGVNGKPAAFDTVLRGATHAITSVANHLHAPTPMPSSGFCVRRIDVVPLFSSLNRAWKQG
jgi:hypothetical protein